MLLKDFTCNWRSFFRLFVFVCFFFCVSFFEGVCCVFFTPGFIGVGCLIQGTVGQKYPLMTSLFFQKLHLSERLIKRRPIAKKKECQHAWLCPISHPDGGLFCLTGGRGSRSLLFAWMARGWCGVCKGFVFGFFTFEMENPLRFFSVSSSWLAVIPFSLTARMWDNLSSGPMWTLKSNVLLIWQIIQLQTYLLFCSRTCIWRGGLGLKFWISFMKIHIGRMECYSMCFLLWKDICHARNHIGGSGGSCHFAFFFKQTHHNVVMSRKHKDILNWKLVSGGSIVFVIHFSEFSQSPPKHRHAGETLWAMWRKWAARGRCPSPRTWCAGTAF